MPQIIGQDVQAHHHLLLGRLCLHLGMLVMAGGMAMSVLGMMVPMPVMLTVAMPLTGFGLPIGDGCHHVSNGAHGSRSNTTCIVIHMQFTYVDV